MAIAYVNFPESFSNRYYTLKDAVWASIKPSDLDGGEWRVKNHDEQSFRVTGTGRGLVPAPSAALLALAIMPPFGTRSATCSTRAASFTHLTIR